MEELLEILNELHDDINYETETRLVDDKLFDSFDLITLVAELSDAFDIEITAQEFIPENFNSAQALWRMIQELSGE